MGDHFFWYLTRSAGLVAYLLLFACVSLGLLMTTNLLSQRWPRGRIYDLHRFLSLLTLGVIVLHVLIVLPDAFFHFSLAQLLLPFASPYRMLYMTLGVFSLYLTGVIIGSFYLMPALPYRAWRLIHYATFGAYLLALAHGIGAGTDTSFAWAIYLYAITGLAVTGLALERLLRGSSRGIPSPAKESLRGRLPTRSPL